MIKRLASRVFASSFIRHASILASGTVAANLITLLMLPLFSRLFSQQSFGLQSLLILGTMVLGTLATGYYDWAIPTPKTKAQAARLATLALLLCVGLAALLLALLLCFGQPLLNALAIGPLQGWAWALPPLAATYGCYYIGNYWLLRAGHLRDLALIRFVLPVTNAVVSLVLGLKGVDTGLITGFIAGVLLSGVVSLLLARRAGLRFEFAAKLGTLAAEYKEFPLYGSIPAAAMMLAGQIPLLVITRGYTLDLTGQYAVVRNIIFNGTLMVATACGQVVLKHIAEHKNNGEAVWPHFRRMALQIGAVGVAVGAAIYLTSPLFFHLYLGEQWAGCIPIAQRMACVMPLWMLGIALATAPIGLRRLKPIAGWQLGYGMAACWLFTLTGLPFMAMVDRVMGFDAVAYGLYIAISMATIYRHGR